MPPVPLVGPKKSPRDFGFAPKDSHLVVNDQSETLTAFDFHGNKLFRIPALARGQGGDRVYWENSTDTPPGLYRIGQVYNDVGRVGLNPREDRTLRAYGWLSFDLEELENQERRHNRAGIMLHGGGSACGWPGAWDSRQELHPTLGCVRCHNIDLRDRILPLVRQGRVFVSVYQEG